MRTILKGIGAFVAFYIVLLLIGHAASAYGAGVWAVAGFLVGLGLVIRWLAGRGSRIRGSGRDPRDFGDTHHADSKYQRPFGE
jgi:hypothetical protein